MNIMLVLIIAVLIVILSTYYSVSRSFISPLSLLLISFIMAFSIILANTENWQVKMDFRLILYVSIAIGSFAVGALIANAFSEPALIGNGDRCNLPFQRTFESNDLLICLVLLDLVCTFAYVVMAVRMGLSAGTGDTLFRSIYEASAENSSNFIFHQFREIIVAVAEISIIAGLKQKYVDKSPIYKPLFIPLLCFGACTMFATDRNIFLRFIIFALCLWILFVSSTSTKTIQRKNIHIIFRTMIVLVVAVSAFYLLGKIKSYTSDLERTIGIYGGSGLYNFNLFIDRFETVRLQYGKETFSQLIKVLERFGLDLPGSSSAGIGLDMVVKRAPNGYVYASNIYSAMAPYMIDLGVFGLILFPCLMGMFFKSLYNWAARSSSYYLWGLYSMMVYAVVYFTIDEQFFMRLHLGLVYELVWFTIFYLIVFGTKKTKFRFDMLA